MGLSPTMSPPATTYFTTSRHSYVPETQETLLDLRKFDCDARRDYLHKGH